MSKNADAATVTATPAKRGRKLGTVAVPVTVMVSYYSRVHGVPVTEDMAVSLYRGADKAGKDAMTLLPRCPMRTSCDGMPPRPGRSHVGPVTRPSSTL